MKILVVAKHHEDTAWTSDVPDEWNFLVVTKDLEVPKADREASSWLWAMEQLWVETGPEDQIAFVQGDPFPHEPNLIEVLNDGLAAISYVPIGNQHHIDDWNGFPHGGGLEIRKFWERHIGDGCPQYFPFVAGGQFAISGDNLCSRDRGWYTGLYEAAVEEPKAPWILERLWGSIL